MVEIFKEYCDLKDVDREFDVKEDVAEVLFSSGSSEMHRFFDFIICVLHEGRNASLRESFEIIVTCLACAASGIRRVRLLREDIDLYIIKSKRCENVNVYGYDYD